MNALVGLAIRTGRKLAPRPAPAAPVPLGSARFLRGLWITMRPYLLFVSGITGLLGMSLGPVPPAFAGVVLGAVFFLAYGFGQAVTDCFQTDTDALSSPYRPLVRGEIAGEHVLGVSLAALAASAAVLGVLHPGNLGLGALAVVGLLTYTWMKRRWWGGPPHNSWIVALLVPMGALATAGAAGIPAAFDARTAWAVGAAFFGYAAFVVSGYAKDVVADRATGYDTVMVRFGRKRAAWICHGLALAAVLATAGLLASSPHRTGIAGAVVLLLALAGAGGFALGEIRLHRVREDAEAHRAVLGVLYGYVFCLAAGTAANRPGWIPILLLFLVLFALTLRSRPAREQV